MAERRRTSQGRTVTRERNQYIHGSTVRKLEPVREAPQNVPSKERQQKLNNRKKQEIRASHRVRRNQEKALHMDLPYVFVLSIAAVCALWLCVNYLHIQSSMTSRIHNIQDLEKDLEVLKANNDALETRINTYVDLDYVYKVATEELGMVYANKDQIILYDKSESEYVRQYEDIPEH